ncbi:hypothetical protein [Bilophila wadsworthia]|uniref:hypothetical protein n=1 Tax=Bilophila wadsworthia TaxID=35833 RepID=UPI00321FDAF2
MAARFDWETIRAEYETGATQSELSRKHGCSRTAIQKRIEREGWVQDVSDAIDRLAQAKVAGVVAGCNPEKKAAAVEAAADRKASVIQGHRDAWPDIKALNRRAIAENDFDLAKLAKISAETERLIQDGERKAWGIADKIEEMPGVVAAVHSVSAEIVDMLEKVKAVQE